MINKLFQFETFLRQDFVKQKRFKANEFFGFAAETYKIMITFNNNQLVDTINTSICEIMDSIENWDGDS